MTVKRYYLGDLKVAFIIGDAVVVGEVTNAGMSPRCCNMARSSKVRVVGKLKMLTKSFAF